MSRKFLNQLEVLEDAVLPASEVSDASLMTGYQAMPEDLERKFLGIATRGKNLSILDLAGFLKSNSKSQKHVCIADMNP